MEKQVEGSVHIIGITTMRTLRMELEATGPLVERDTNKALLMCLQSLWQSIR